MCNYIAGEEERVAKAVHTMVRVLDLHRSITFYQDAFGLAEADRFDFEIELILNKGQTKPYELGYGYGPGRLIGDGEAIGKFFFVADPDSYQVEVLHRGGRSL